MTTRLPILIAIWILTVCPADGQNLSLQQAAEIALRQHPMVRGADSAVKLADSRTDEAAAGRRPAVQVNETWTRSNNPVFVFGSLLEQGRFGAANFALDSLNNPDSLSNLRSSVTVRYPVFDGFNTSGNITQARIGSAQARREAEFVRQQIRFDVIRDYYGLVAAQANLDLAESAVTMAESDLERARSRVNAGVAVDSDLLSARVQLADLQRQRVQAEGDVAIAETALRISMGVPGNTPLAIRGSLQDSTFNISSSEELVEQALAKRADFQGAGAAIETSQAKLHQAAGERLPRLDLFANAASSHSFTAHGSSDYAIGASATWNLFDAGRGARAEQARQARDLATARREELAGNIRLEVIRSYKHYITAEEQRGVAQMAAGLAEESLRIVRDRYDAGLASITDLLHAETALVRSRANLTASRHDVVLTFANILLSTGGLTDLAAFEGN